MSGPNYPFPTPRHTRTSSSTSVRSQAALGTSPADARRPPNLSRQSSASRTGSPGPQVHAPDSLQYLHQQRVPHSVSGSSVVATPGSVGYAEQLSPGLLAATAQYEETAFYRAELEVAKRENEALKRRVRELVNTTCFMCN